MSTAGSPGLDTPAETSAISESLDSTRTVVPPWVGVLSVAVTLSPWSPAPTSNSAMMLIVGAIIVTDCCAVAVVSNPAAVTVTVTVPRASPSRAKPPSATVLGVFDSPAGTTSDTTSLVSAWVRTRASSESSTATLTVMPGEPARTTCTNIEIPPLKGTPV